MTSVHTTRREAIATALRTTFADMPTGWVVYAQQQDVVSLPCVVVAPRDPYRVPLAFADATGAQREQTNLFVGMYVRRDAGNTATDVFDEAGDRVLAAFALVQAAGHSVGWESIDAPAGDQVAGVDILMSTVDIEVV